MSQTEGGLHHHPPSCRHTTHIWWDIPVLLWRNKLWNEILKKLLKPHRFPHPYPFMPNWRGPLFLLLRLCLFSSFSHILRTTQVCSLWMSIPQLLQFDIKAKVSEEEKHKDSRLQKQTVPVSRPQWSPWSHLGGAKDVPSSHTSHSLPCLLHTRAGGAALLMVCHPKASTV